MTHTEHTSGLKGYMTKREQRAIRLCMEFVSRRYPDSFAEQHGMGNFRHMETLLGKFRADEIGEK